MKVVYSFLLVCLTLLGVNAEATVEGKSEESHQLESVNADSMSDETKSYSVLGVEFEDQEMANKVTEHLLEAEVRGVDPIEFAFGKDDLELAETLFKIREHSLENGMPTWEFPGYRFSRRWQHQSWLPVWLRIAPTTYLTKWGGKRISPNNKLDVEAMKLLMKYDKENLWYYEIGKIGQHAYQFCDLEGLYFCLIITRDHLPERPPTKFPNEQVAAKIRIGQILLGPPRYLVDPFKSDFPIDLKNPAHFYSRSKPCQEQGELHAIWEYRPDDNEIVRSLKKQVQSVWNPINWEEELVSYQAKTVPFFSLEHTD